MGMLSSASRFWAVECLGPGQRSGGPVHTCVRLESRLVCWESHPKAACSLEVKSLRFFLINYSFIIFIAP